MISGEIPTNVVPKTIKHDDEALKDLEEKTSPLDSAYSRISFLQRLSFLYREKEVKYCICGKPLKWRNFTKGYNKSCGDKKCVARENVDSQRKFYLENYGIDHLFKTEKFKEDLKKTFIEKYGTDNPGKSKEIKEKIKQTNLKRFGKTSWLKVKENRERISQKLKERNENLRIETIKRFNIPIEILKFNNGGEITIGCKECDNETTFSHSYFQKNIAIGKNPCLHCNPPLFSESNREIELANYISEIYSGKIERKNRKILSGKEIDVFLPELKIGFEFNGIYYHSEIFKSKESILEKKGLAGEQGINLITIWEDDWTYKNDIIKSRISNLLGKSRKLQARKCQIREIIGSEEKGFLVKNHIQGYVPSSIKIGLFYEGDLVSVMTFGKYRVSLGKKEKEGEYELLRFCNSLNVLVIGGASKLFNYFLQKYKPIKVLSYQNNSWNTGNLYENLGFEKIGLTKQNYYWCVGDLRYNRFNFRKDKLVKEGYDPQKTEDEIMTQRGYFKSWDLGNIKWEYKKV